LSLNLANNHLEEQVLPQGWSEDLKTGYSAKKEYTHTDGSKQDQHPGKPEGIIALAIAIPNMGAILSVDLLKNGIGVAQAEGLVNILKAHPTLKSLCGNKGNETKLNMSGKMHGAEDAILLGPEIAGNAALLKLIFGGNSYQGDWNGTAYPTITPEPATLEVGMTEIDLSNKGLGAAGAIIAAAWISHRDNGAISQFTFSGDNAGTKPVTMETSMVEADFNGKALGVSGAIMVGAFLPKCTYVPEYPFLVSADTPSPAIGRCHH
jgi:hypothetical protein